MRCIVIIQNMSVVSAVVSFQMLMFWNVQLQFLRFNLIVSWNSSNIVTYVIITNFIVSDIHTYKQFLEVTYNLCSNGHNKHNLITLQVLPFCTYALAAVVLPLLDAPLESSLDMIETYHCILEYLLLTQNGDFWAKSRVQGKHMLRCVRSGERGWWGMLGIS